MNTGAAAPPTLAVGFDIGGTNIRAEPVRSDGTIGDTVRGPRPSDPRALVETIGAIVEQVAAAEGRRAEFIGIGCAGIVDRHGVVRTSPNIPELVRFPLRAEIEALVGPEVPVAVDNDATTATWAETRLGAAAGHRNVAFVALGTGIGTGFVFDGTLHRGAYGFAGESGHMIVVHEGIHCACGRRGCWERYASGTAYGRHAREAAHAGESPAIVARAGGDPEAVRSEHVTEMVAAGHPEALAVLDVLAHWVAVGVGNLVNIVDPSIVVLGGGLADMGQVLVDAVERAYRVTMIDHELRDPVAFAPSRFRGRSGAIGAAMLHEVATTAQ